MTDQPKWTPGPWRATTHDHPEQGVYAGYRIAKMTGGEIQRDRANANLIAAAPDLYAALDAAYDFIADQYGDAEAQALEGEFVSKEARAIWETICAALAKARGETK